MGRALSPTPAAVAALEGLCRNARATTMLVQQSSESERPLHVASPSNFYNHSGAMPLTCGPRAPHRPSMCHAHAARESGTAHMNGM